jgi:hypothetical protein
MTEKIKEFHINNTVLYNKYSHYIASLENNEAPLENNELINVVKDINYALDAVGTISISIYTNSIGSIYAVDNKNNSISNRPVLTMVYTYPFLDNSDGNTNITDGHLSFIFEDYGKFELTDTNVQYWYYITGVQPPNVKQLT